MVDFKKLVRSFKVAGEGLMYLFKTEQNFRIETMGVVIISGFIIYMQPTVLEVAILSMVTGSVLVMEIMNTVLEKLLDILTKRKSKNFKILKDIMASAVLLNAIIAIVVAGCIFSKYF